MRDESFFFHESSMPSVPSVNETNHSASLHHGEANVQPDSHGYSSDAELRTVAAKQDAASLSFANPAQGIESVQELSETGSAVEAGHSQMLGTRNIEQTQSAVQGILETLVGQVSMQASVDVAMLERGFQANVDLLRTCRPRWQERGSQKTWDPTVDRRP